MGSPAARQPSRDRGNYRAHTSGGTAKGHQKRANGGDIKPSGTRWRRTRPQSGHVLNVKLQEFLTERASQLIHPLSIRVLLG